MKHVNEMKGDMDDMDDMEGMMVGGMENSAYYHEMEAEVVRRKNFNAPDCNKDYSEDDALYMRRCSDRSKPAPVDPYKKSMEY